jgi:hypothetical protein
MDTARLNERRLPGLSRVGQAAICWKIVFEDGLPTLELIDLAHRSYRKRG